MVLGIPTGGVPVAAQVARALSVPLGVLAVRKVLIPENPQLALGAISSSGAAFMDPEVAPVYGYTRPIFQELAEKERTELQRMEALYYAGQPENIVRGKIALLINDFVASGAGFRAAAAAARKMQAGAVVLAAPIGLGSSIGRVLAAGDVLVATTLPEYASPHDCYQNEGPTEEEVLEILNSFRN